MRLNLEIKLYIYSMKKKLLLLLLILATFYSCSTENTDNLPTEEATTTINGKDFLAKKSHAYIVKNIYLFTITSNQNETILIATTDTLSGTYNMLSIDDIDIDIQNDSLNINFDELENNPNFQQKNIAFGGFVQHEEIYFTKTGNINIIKDKNKISGSFNMQLKSSDGNEVDIKNGRFNHLPSEHITLTPNDEIEKTEATEEYINFVFDRLYSQLELVSQHQFLFDAFYTHQINLNSNWNNIKNHNITANNNFVQDFWTNLFKHINNVNHVTKHIPNTYKENQTLINNKLAEAYAHRAFAYSLILNWFGNAPILLNEIDNPMELHPTFNTSSEIERQIITDLNFAIDNLPNHSDASKINKDFSKIMLARVYFKQKEYTKVIQVLEPIVTENKYALSNTITAPTEKELIYDINIDEEINSSIESDYKRFINTTNLPLAKYSEVLLMLAEANNQKGNSNTSIAYINQLKVKSNEDTITSVTKDELSEIIFNQWNKELSLEGNRFQNLKNYNKAIDSLNIKEHQLILPIPISEINYNPNVKQNPGY